MTVKEREFIKKVRVWHDIMMSKRRLRGKPCFGVVYDEINVWRAK